MPTAPRSALTVPSTRYTSAEPLPSTWVAADRSSIHPSHGHTPLAVMLVLTQAAVGMTVAAVALGTDALATVGLATGLVALAASVLHLGQPLRAWRAILGLRRSWLSREILAFGVFAGAGVAATGLRMVDDTSPLVAAAELAGAAGGLAGVFCSVRLYAVTGRRWWRSRTTGLRFGGTTLACGALGTAGVVCLADPRAAEPLLGPLLVATVVGVATSVLAPLLPLARPRAGAVDEPLRGTRRLLGHQLQNRFFGRLAAAAVGLVLLLVAGAQSESLAAGELGTGVWLTAAWIAVMVGELHERRLFFLASVAPRMPGSPR